MKKYNSISNFSVTLVLSFTIILSAFHLKAQTITPSSDGILYVDSSATGSGSGNNWDNAIAQLSDALKWARAEVDSGTAPWLPNESLKIFVAKGTYKPLYDAADGSYTTNNGDDNAFVMVKNVQLYGGFDPANNIDSLSNTRIFDSTGTILSGELNNVYTSSHVVISAGGVGTALLNGFSITAGSAHQILSSIHVNNDTISRSTGGGICLAHSSPLLEYLMIYANMAQTGGGIFNGYSSPTIRNVAIFNNTAKSQAAGIRNKDYSSPTIINTTIADNINTNWGGGMVNGPNSSPKIYNSILSYNSGLYFDNIWNTEPNSRPTFKNSIVYGDSVWQTNWGIDGGNNIPIVSGPSNLIFKDVVNYDYSLEDGSPAIDAGSNVLYTNSGGDLSTDVDLAEHFRLNGNTIDMGPYEYHHLPASTKESNKIAQITLYPNPTNGKFYVKLDKKYAQIGVSIKNVLGKEITHKIFNSADKLDLSIRGNGGLYFITIHTMSGSSTFRVVKY